LAGKNVSEMTYFVWSVTYNLNDKSYSPQMVATIYKYTIENDLTKKKEKRKKKHTPTNSK